MDEHTTDELKDVLSVARDLSIAWKHWFINYDHLFVAILQTNCMATAYTAGFDAALWEAKMKTLYAVDENLPKDEWLPLTMNAERVIRQSYRMAEISHEEKINSVHVLLSILSYENEVSNAFSRAGILFEDIAVQYYKKPVQEFAPIIYPLRKKDWTKWGLFFLSPSAKKREIESLKQNAQTLLMYGQYDECIGICKIGLSIAPGNPAFNEIMVNVFIKQRSFSAALPLIIDLRRKYPENTYYRDIMSYVHEELGNYDEAIAILDDLLTEDPENVHFLNNKGFSLLQQGSYALAAPFFEKAIQIDPQSAFLLNNLGYAKHKLGNTEEGLSLINKSLELDKGNSYAYKNKGIIFLELGNKIAARENFELALKFRYTKRYGHEVAELIKQVS